MNGIIGGYVVGTGARRDALIPVFSPDLSTVERLIELFNEQDGLVVLRVAPTAARVPYELALYAEHGMFVLLLNTAANQETAVIDILSVDGLDCGFVSVLGDTWPRRAVTRDFAVVRQTFRAMARLCTRSKV